MMKSGQWILGLIAALAIGFSSYAQTALTPEAESQAATPEAGIAAVDEAGTQGRIHVVVSGDTLWDISKAYLGTPWVWPSLWKDNPRIVNPHRINPGDKIWISESEIRRLTDAEATRMMAMNSGASNESRSSAESDAESAQEQVPAAMDAEPNPGPTETSNSLFTMAFKARDKRGLLGVQDLESAPKIVESSFPSLFLNEGHEVFIELGENHGAKVGDQFDIVREQAVVRDPESGRTLGRYVERLGVLEIREVGENVSTAIILTARREITRGDRILPRLDDPAEILLTKAPTKIQGKVVYLPDEHTVSASPDVVFLDRGIDDGLEVGNLLDVVRAGGIQYGSTTNYKRFPLPDEVVAQLVVLSTGPKAAMAYVAYAEDALAVGDRFQTVNNN